MLSLDSVMLLSSHGKDILSVECSRFTRKAKTNVRVFCTLLVHFSKGLVLSPLTRILFCSAFLVVERTGTAFRHLFFDGFSKF
jgi:hypothetical protein